VLASTTLAKELNPLHKTYLQIYTIPKEEKMKGTLVMLSKRKKKHLALSPQLTVYNFRVAIPKKKKEKER